LGLLSRRNQSPPDEESGIEEDRGKDLSRVVWMPPAPDQTLPSAHAAEDYFEVLIHDEDKGSRVVAAVELLSPGNKDRPENRHAFAIKCAAYLNQRVSLIIVDSVTDRFANLHANLMELLQLPGLTVDRDLTRLYAVAYRTTKVADDWQLDIWPEQLTLGQPLPTLPLWLASNLAVPLELELYFTRLELAPLQTFGS
jgi:hypothetical protein